MTKYICRLLTGYLYWNAVVIYKLFVI